ncbi:hypothetical protein MKX01_029230 [Papaver californicum]|nr:hypothetical protein MKX01_025085 [Papaver californicum]KAI3994912.1 hypothetical protein MKX01_029230 [Papaver californicum]
MKKQQKYPLGAEHYNLYEEIGRGAMLDFERDKSELCNIAHEAQIMILIDQPNLLKADCSFVTDHCLRVVMPFMAAGSLIATILCEILRGLEYIHQHEDIHRDIKAGNILVDARGAIKLADFGVSASPFDAGIRLHGRKTFVLLQNNEYDFKADIWSFGITALELAHGHAPFSKFPLLKAILMTIEGAPFGLDYESDKKFSKSFRKIIKMCLEKDPRKRPSAQQLLKHSFFKKARSSEYITRTLVKELPSLGDCAKESKKKEDMVVQKKLADVERREIGRYKKGINGWNFDVEALKTEASQLPKVTI